MSSTIVGKYFVDEIGFNFDDDSDAAISDAFSEFVDLLEHAKEEGGRVCYSETIWDISTSSGRSLMDLLYIPSGIDEVSRRLLYSLLQKSQAIDTPAQGGIVSASDPEVSASAGATLCALEVLNKKPASILTTRQSEVRGDARIRLREGNSEVEVFFVATEEDFKHFWRRVPEACEIPAHAIEAIADRAFPESRFIEGVWAGAKEFEGDDIINRRRLIHHLSGLNDHFLSVYSSTNDPNRISAEMGSIAGIDCSKESNKTRRNSKAMASRIRSTGKKDITFEWHTKFEAHRNRIHFAIDEGKLYIGVFCKHLDV